jgi:hypothetical protein
MTLNLYYCEDISEKHVKIIISYTENQCID